MNRSYIKLEDLWLLFSGVCWEKPTRAMIWSLPELHFTGESKYSYSDLGCLECFGSFPGGPCLPCGIKEALYADAWATLSSLNRGNLQGKTSLIIWICSVTIALSCTLSLME